jgi:hypothetical protein
MKKEVDAPHTPVHVNEATGETLPGTFRAESQALAPAQRVDGLDFFDQNSNSGLETVTAQDTLIPRVAIVQAMSDQMKKNHASYIEGAEVGMIVDTAMNEIMEAPWTVLPIVYEKTWIEWHPRSTRKGIAQVHPTSQILDVCSVDPKTQIKNILPNGNTVNETATFYCLNLAAGRRPCFVSFTGTQLRKARFWVTLAKGERLTRSDGSEFAAPLFFRTYNLSTAMESNNNGEWSGWKIERGQGLNELGPSWRNLANSAIELREAIIAGRASADRSNMSDNPDIIDGKAEDAL